MIPVLSAEQIRDTDAYTIKNEPISSVDLMERASRAFVKKFLKIADSGKPVSVFAGPGNNGGDALAVARLLKNTGLRVEVYVTGNPQKASEDFQINYQRLSGLMPINQIDEEKDIPNIGQDRIVIEGLFGSGLSRPVEGLFGKVIDVINASGSVVFAIDIPSGLYADQPVGGGSVIRADHTVSFQVPKLSFFHPSSFQYTGNWNVVDIGLDQKFISSQETGYYFTEEQDIVFPARSRFAHKGDAGRMLLISGSKGKVGATTLSARAAMRSGCGLLFIHAPCCANDILQVNVPEAMVQSDEHEEIITEIPLNDNYDSIAIGPGMGTNSLTKKALVKLLEDARQPLVIDADGINLLASDTNLIPLVPKNSILTPHPGEFKRLVGVWENDFGKLELLQHFCKKNQLNVVLKGAFSVVCDTDGIIFFNPTGNPGMATGGSGDVLTGIIGALVGQGLSPLQAAKSGVYLHGAAGDMALEDKGVISMIASDIIDNLPAVMR